MIDLYPNETFPILWAIFLVVLFFLHQWVFKPTLDIINARKGQTDVLHADALKLSQKNQADLMMFEKKISETRALAALERDRIIKEARKQESDVIAKAKLEAEKQLTEMQLKLKEERDESTERLNRYAQQMAKEISEKVLERVA